MFPRFPDLQRLISWTKPDAPVARGTREYEWYDHNSLVGDADGHQSLSRCSWTATSTSPRVRRWSPRSRSSPRVAACASGTAAAGSRPAARTTASSCRPPTASTAAAPRVRDRRDRALEAEGPGLRACRPLHDTRSPQQYRGQASASSASGTRASRSPTACSRGRGGAMLVAAAGEHRGDRLLPLRLALPPAVRRVRPRRLRQATSRRLDRAGRSAGGRLPRRRPGDDPARAARRWTWTT